MQTQRLGNSLCTHSAWYSVHYLVPGAYPSQKYLAFTFQHQFSEIT